jgi:hypothetical protein
MSTPNMEIPEHLRTGPLADAAAKALQDAQSMASSSNSVPRISLKGREFRLIESGEEVAKFRDVLDVIVLGVEPGPGQMIKTFYEKGYTQGAKEPPTCASDDGIAPSPWVQNKQAQQCRTCPKNQFGSAISPSGKQTKACRDSKRAWLVIADGNVSPGKPGEEGKPFLVSPSIAERTLYGLNVTVASLKTFSDHGRQLTALGQGPAVCVTRLIMQDGEFPQLDFKLQAWLSADLAPQSLKLADDRPWKVYNSSALALAMAGSTESSGPKSTLPMSVPDHLKAKAAAGNVEDVQPKNEVSNKEINDQLGTW